MSDSANNKRRLRYVVIGAGMAGMLAGVKLKERGEQLVILEKGDSVGGTWRDNRYPGLTCDTPSHCYTYSFAPYPEWTSNFASGPEIRAYFEKVARDYDLHRNIQFGSEVSSCLYDDKTKSWLVGLTNGEQHEADVVIAASGVLHHPNVPALPGIESFNGKWFHSARWDDEAVVDNARVGVIGSGSTGVQIVAALADRSSKVVHLQRSPQWILPAEFQRFTDAQIQSYRDDPNLIEKVRNSPEYWKLIFDWTEAIIDAESEGMKRIEEICRVNLEQCVKDAELREKLRPDYRAACKRMIISWNYYGAVQKPNVVIDIGAIDQIVPSGVRMRDGTLHEIDMLVLATGFKAHNFIRPAKVLGRGGVDLDHFWAKRPTAYYAVTIPGFPNFFMLNGPTGPVGNFPLIDIAEREWSYIDQLLERLRAGARAVEVKSEAHADYERRRIEAAKKTIFYSGCKSWYLDSEGIPSTWPWGYETFAAAMKDPRFEDYHFA